MGHKDAKQVTKKQVRSMKEKGKRKKNLNSTWSYLLKIGGSGTSNKFAIRANGIRVVVTQNSGRSSFVKTMPALLSSQVDEHVDKI
ncbi:Phosphoglucosamine mutase [Trichinella pseudospiralis]